MYLLSWVNERILFCLQLASYSQGTIHDVTSLLFVNKKVLGCVGLDESGKEKAKLRGIGLVQSCVDLGRPICSHCVLSLLSCSA